MTTVKQYQSGGKTWTNISLGNSSSKDSIKALKAKLNGKTYMNFEVCAAPIGGSWHVFVQTSYDGTPDEIIGMLLHVMADI